MPAIEKNIIFKEILKLSILIFRPNANTEKIATITTRLIQFKSNIEIIDLLNDSFLLEARI